MFIGQYSTCIARNLNLLRKLFLSKFNKSFKFKDAIAGFGINISESTITGSEQTAVKHDIY
jgi:hypothetical protein